MDGGGGTMSMTIESRWLKSRSASRKIVCVLGVTSACLALAPGRAMAEPGATEKATAEALFQQGAELMAEKQFAAACEKFAGSQQLDPALGTLLRQADCNDRIGKTASAWAMFKEASSMARSRNEPDRQRIADERGGDLEKRLSRLEVKVDAKNLPSGFEVKLNGVSIPRATWDAALPVDPGRQKLEASAPGRITWTGSVEVPEGPATRSIEVPALAVKPVDASATAVGSTSGPSVRDSSNPGSAQRTVGFVLGGLGVVGLGLGGYFGYRAYGQNQDSLELCRSDDANACTAEGKSLRDDARGSATGSTIAVAAGAGLLVGGLVLVLTAPHSTEGRRAGNELRVSTALMGRGGSGLQLQGTW